MSTITQDEAKEAVEMLAQTTKGTNALRHLLSWFDDDGLGLDRTNQAAVITLLEGAWGDWPGSVRDWMREHV